MASTENIFVVGGGATMDKMTILNHFMSNYSLLISYTCNIVYTYLKFQGGLQPTMPPYLRHCTHL